MPVNQTNNKLQTDEFSYADRRLRLRTMRLSVIEGMLAMVAIGLQQAFYIPYLYALGASALAIGIGAGAVPFMSGLVQIFTPFYIRVAGSYRRLLLLSVFGQALSFVPFAMIVYLVPGRPVWYTIAAMAVSSAAVGIGAGAWADWMSCIVPRRRRGKYFANRNRLTTLVQLALSLLASRLLDSGAGKVILVFTIIWMSCCVSRIIAGVLFFWHYEPAGIAARPVRKTDFFEFLGQIHKEHFGRFVLAMSLLNLAANFSAPFFAIYMLKDLQFSYFKYSSITLIAAFATVLTMRFWGGVCDRLGSVMPMRLAVTVITFLPAGWLLWGNFWYLLALNALAGVVWGGHALTTFNYTIGSLPAEKRLVYISYMNVISAVFTFAGSALGGLIGPMLPLITAHQLHSIFLFSVLLRVVPNLIFQSLPADKPAGAKMSALDNFFFDPRLFVRTGVDRMVFTKQRRPF